ncbi:AAA family ATPase [Flaviaesturariibacter amylovorans]|uniref:AAA family ATPase n=1 Tax=Flaviaesturariibacter amylovorans TaxID=1084520 RepID=A0ABP8GF06_9BACT
MWTLTDNKDWAAVRRSFSWVRDMEGVPQDPVHHAEGDVAVHTRLVLEALETLPEYRLLGAQERETLWAAALLHDVEKRSTTVIEPDGRVTAQGHARKGALTARSLLYLDQPAPFALREAVVNLVRYHGLPLWAIDKPDPAKAVIGACLVADTRLLSLLARADALGRQCADREDLLYRIGLFDALCQEHDCWGRPYAFATPHARFQYFRKEEAYPGFVPFDEFGSTVVLMSGLPGAGKDTHIARHYRDWPVVSLDDIRRAMKVSPTDKTGNGHAIQAAKEAARSYLRAGRNFVWNATNITRNLRGQLVDLCVTYKAYVRIDYVEVPYVELLAQNAGREAVVPAAAIDRLVQRLEVPAPEEAHEVHYFARNA